MCIFNGAGPSLGTVTGLADASSRLSLDAPRILTTRRCGSRLATRCTSLEKGPGKVLPVLPMLAANKESQSFEISTARIRILTTLALRQPT